MRHKEVNRPYDEHQNFIKRKFHPSMIQLDKSHIEKVQNQPDGLCDRIWRMENIRDEQKPSVAATAAETIRANAKAEKIHCHVLFKLQSREVCE